MAKIYISYSSKDRELVNQYVNKLREFDHEIFMDDTVLQAGKDMQRTLMDAMKNADGTIVFLTRNGIESKHVLSEIGIARSYHDNYNKFLIPLVDGDINVPYLIQDLMYLQIAEAQPTEIVKKIDITITTIKKYQETKKGKFTNVNLKASLTPIIFAKSLFDYINSLELDSYIFEWVFKGKTNEAYGTPLGPWETVGFLFKNQGYSFIVRSIWDAGQDIQATYLVVESNNLGGQLANVALDKEAKFNNENGRVQIFETYDMTVGWGRRSRYDVQEAFKKAGLSSNIITSFDSNNINWKSIINDILQWSIIREKAKLILQANPKERQPDNISSIQESSISNFWLLKIYGDNWGINSIKLSDVGHFNSFFNSKEKRPEYDFFKKVKEGDKGVAYDYSTGKEIVFLFEIIEPLHYDENRQEIISFVIIVKPKKGVSLMKFTDQIKLDEGINSDSINKLFSLTSEQYDEVFKVMTQEVDFVNYNYPTISHILSDSATKDIKDELGFENDVNALATVIAYRQVKPPLAIGLFGNWGTGKSFFMNKLQEKIEDLEKENSDMFCKKVLQINFNSWHYSDSNLWASLITKIFDELEIYGKDSPEELAELFKNLNSTKELLADTKNEKVILDKKINTFKEQKKILEADVIKQSNNLTSLSLTEILKELMKDTSVQDDFEKLKQEYSFLNLNEYDGISENIKKLDDFSGKSAQSFILFISFLKGKKLFALISIVIIGLGVFALNENSLLV